MVMALSRCFNVSANCLCESVPCDFTTASTAAWAVVIWAACFNLWSAAFFRLCAAFCSKKYNLSSDADTHSSHLADALGFHRALHSIYSLAYIDFLTIALYYTSVVTKESEAYDRKHIQDH